MSRPPFVFADALAIASRTVASSASSIVATASAREVTGLPIEWILRNRPTVVNRRGDDGRFYHRVARAPNTTAAQYNAGAASTAALIKVACSVLFSVTHPQLKSAWIRSSPKLRRGL